MGANQGSGDGQRIKALERGFEIVEYLEAEGSVTVTELSESLDLPTSTAHVYLKTLHDAGYVVKDGSSYRLGLRFLKHGGHARQRSRLYRVAWEEADAIAEATNEVSAIGVEENGKRVLLYKSEGTDALYDNPPVGEHTDMHWTALGKAILAHLPKDRVERIVERSGLPAETDQTITSASELDAELERVRECGYAIEDEERWDGIRSIAVPILEEESVVGALSISGPTRRFEYDRMEGELLDRLNQARNVVELQLAHE